MAEFLFACFVVAAICAVVGAFIDETRGALWGGLLGPLGLIIAAILKEKSSVQLQTKTHSTQLAEDSLSRIPSAKAPNQMDVANQKWQILKEVDPDIRLASERLSAIDPKLDAELANKYLVLAQKEYLTALVDSVIAAHQAKLDDAERLAQTLSTDVLEGAQKQKAEFFKSLGPDGYDPDLKSKVLAVDIYDGSWVGWKGGLRISLEDGRTILINKGLRRAFPPGDARWV